MSATFHEVRFPTSISQGAVGGMRFSTKINTTASGFEQRNITWEFSRGEWDVAHGLKTPEQIGQLIDFFAARRGRAYGFRFQDYSDYRLPRWRNTPGDIDAVPVQMTTDGGTTTSFQIHKPYIDAAGTYIRLIQKPQAGTVQMLDNGVPSFDYTIDTTTGIVTLGSTLRATTGHLVAIACQFDVPARFDTDDQKVNVTMLEIMGWQAIPIVEIRDI